VVYLKYKLGIWGGKIGMGNYLNIGNDGFEMVRKGKYVDKTGLIAFINSTLGTQRKLTCVSRPRRFGKSFAAKMLCAYYGKGCDSRELFQGLKIASDESFEEHLNKYDVIYLDMTSFISEADNLKNVLADIRTSVIEEVRLAYPEVKQSDKISLTLSNVAEATGNKFFIIIDEWDALFREAKNDTELQKEYIGLLRSLFKGALTDKMLIGAYMTGILPIKKYGTQSALTDFKEYSMLEPKMLEEYVGFTEDEVKNLCDEYGMNFEEMKRWYDGYSFTNVSSVYSPNSVMEAVLNRKIGNYWTKTETYESLKIYIDMNEDGLKEAIVQMLGGAKCRIDVETFQNDMTSITCRDDVLTLLIHLGYLAYDEKSESAYIPNEEVRREFVRAVKYGRHKEVARLIQNSDRLLQATLAMDSETVATAIEEAHSAGTAPLFYNDEQALRSVIRFAYISCIDEYLRIEELPSGIGYADVVYLPKKNSNKPIMVVELKWNKTAEGAITQIKNRNYPQVLEGFGSEILLVGVNYNEKSKEHTCVIEKYRRE
jgi:hypothetical protein